MTIINPLPFTLLNGTTADASQVMADLNEIRNDVNANAAHNGANSDITSLTGLTTPLSVAQGGTGSTTGGGSSVSSFVANNTGQTVTTLVKITFATVVFNIGSNYSAVNSRWTPPVGRVLIHGQVTFTWGAVAPTPTPAFVTIYKNGFEFFRGTQPFYTNGVTTSGVVSLIDSANGTDYYEIFANSNVGAGVALGSYTSFQGTII